MLLQQARVKVDNDGYVYKKGRSRSKRIRDDNDESPQHPKRTKTSESMRSERITHIEETMKDLNQQLHDKERRREQVNNSRSYRLCKEITDL